MGRICKICAEPERMRIAAEMIAAGQPDRVVAEALGGMNRMAVQRHRTNHMAGRPGVVAVARQAAEQRLAVLEAAPPVGPFDPASYLSRDGIAADLDAIDRRLSIAAMAAAVDGRSAVLAQLSAQQLRLMETRAKLGEVGGYGRERPNGAGGVGAFTINFNFSETEPSLTITTACQPENGLGVPEEAAWRPSPPPNPEQHPLAAGGPSSVFRSMMPVSPAI